MNTISRKTRGDLVTALKERYERSSKSEKSIILREFVAVSGCHRKHAIRLLNRKGQATASAPGGRRIYDEAVKSALTILWEASDRICGKRLKALLPALIVAMEKHGHLKLAVEVREKLLSVSAATIDRTLQSVKKTAHPRRKRKAPKKISKDIPIKTFSDWKDPAPGFLEIDFVVHGGGSMAGEYLHSLAATDVCSGWVEAVALLAREQSLVVEGLKQIQNQLPVKLRGIDSDNDSAFINDTLAHYCAKEGFVFTRSRAHHSNDQAWIEQKNGAVIRKMVGYERYSGLVAGQILAQLLRAACLYVNFFQPSFKLRERTREGSKIRKSYLPPATPCDRLLSIPDVDEVIKASLRQQRERLDPVELLHKIRQGQAALAALNTNLPEAGPARESLEQFLAALPQLWRMGEPRPTHRKPGQQIRYWRTRKDPFQNAWGDILHWLQAAPDSTAKNLLQLLCDKYPGQFHDGYLRTLQRRIGEWRHAMARKLVLGGCEEPGEITAIAKAPIATAKAGPGLATLAPPQPSL